MASGVALHPKLCVPIPARMVPASHHRRLCSFFHNVCCAHTTRTFQFRYCLSRAKCCLVYQEPTMKDYEVAFSRRMELAGLHPHHRIAIGVSGGPDSMALCALTASWKLNGCHGDGVGIDKNDGCIGGLLGIIVDHGLRPESNHEAKDVSRRVSAMGIRCEITTCTWLDGKPKLGQVQEAAREKRFQIFQKACFQHQIGVLLIAHHADDQAELFVLRLSRNSGVLGLAGMAFTTQVFPFGNPSDNGSFSPIIVVRPLLEFTKADMYKICRIWDLQWVEDPTNQSVQYARNRIRMALMKFPSSCSLELQLIIAACRKTRAYVENVSRTLLHKAVTILDEGYAVVDLEILTPSEVEDLCLSKFISSLMQFISQGNRNIRGHTTQLLLEYLRNFPCKTSFTASGCYLCPAPRSKGTKMLICCSVDCPLPPETELCYIYPKNDHELQHATGLHEIFAGGQSHGGNLIHNDVDAPFLNTTSATILEDGVRLSMISESNYHNILKLRREETASFRSQIVGKIDCKPNWKLASYSRDTIIPLQSHQICYFMNRFVVQWERSSHLEDKNSRSIKNLHFHSCRMGNKVSVNVRTMMDCDWLYLAALSKRLESTECEFDGLKQSTKRAISLLKCIPVAARRSLPVLVSSEGQLLNIPSISFSYCTCITASCRFIPRMTLGGDHASFL